MHREVAWAMPVDLLILEFLHETRFRGEPIIVPPKTISRHIHYGRKHVADRCRTLAEKGLVERVDGKAEYRITETGSQVVEREISYSELE